MSKCTGIFLLIALSLTSACASGTQARMEPTEIRRDTSHYLKDNKALYDLHRKMVNFVRIPDSQREREIFTLLENRVDYQHFVEQLSFIQLPVEQIIQQQYPSVPQSTSACEIKEEAQTGSWKFIHGNCEEGLAHGSAHAIWSDGKQKWSYWGRFLEGYLMEGVLDKQGRYVYVGALKDGRPNGKGTMRRHYDNNIFIGGFVNQNIHGWGGHVTYQSESKKHYIKYIGQWDNAAYHGIGVRVLEYNPDSLTADGSRFVPKDIHFASFVKSKAEGLGAFSWYDHNRAGIFVGEYKKGNRHGFGMNEKFSTKYHFRNGSAETANKVWLGKYVNGKREGRTVLLRYGYVGDTPGVHDQYYKKGELESSETRGGFDFMKALAIGTVAAGAMSADISTAGKVEVISAVTADVVGETNGSHLQHNYSRSIRLKWLIRTRKLERLIQPHQKKKPNFFNTTIPVPVQILATKSKKYPISHNVVSVP